MHTRMNFRFQPINFARWPAMAILALLLSGHGRAQVVQLPTTGTFSLQTSVMAPDSGSAFLGGSRASSASTRSLGPGSIASGGSARAGMATVQATIIDLEELDQMIRSQAGSKPFLPDLATPPKKKWQYHFGNNPKPSAKAEYEYLAALTHVGPTSPSQMSSDVTYYLSLANNAQKSGHWASVELYYKLAWQSLPESRRQSVLASLEEARKTAAANEQNAKK